MPRAPSPDDVEQLRHVAADADGEALADADLAFLASEQQVLMIDDHGDLVVVGIATTSYYRAEQVRTAIAAALPVWTVIRDGKLPSTRGLRDDGRR